MSSSQSPPVPRPSSSLVIVNNKNEILLVHRNPLARTFGGVHVFPGGNHDKKQDASLKVTAIRETFEEAGLLLASPINPALSGPSIPQSEFDHARRAIHSQSLFFQDFLESHKLKPDVDSMLPFTEWITPTHAPRRFHTQFFVAFLQGLPSSGFSSGAREEYLPKPDGGQEVISARFLHPVDALREFHDKKISLMPPQYYILSTLASILTGHVNTVSQRETVAMLSHGPFGRMVINPKRLFVEDKEGRTILTYEGDETRGGPKGSLHRAFVKVGKGGVTSEITLQRNFDIFSEVDKIISIQSSKL
ncbi:hypothetical protein AMATHDRAFT_72755 [Amanita thiersii Skay4041]|uniref:Nudix hydrolase domain-containing protein n=1 Tax=Amanita thiersii Skay4041 TaxID=703135 RepID=A0A2A9P0X3_9AGAR|nr:hypothetical protein AMATHDRAFT_72755 [Amanita thiersii Skay4041]